MMNDNESYRTAYVYVKGIFAGEIRETDEGYIFNYDKAYLSNEKNPAVSLTMQKREEKYISKVLFPFFDGLIPEGWLLNIVTYNWKISSNDRFGLLQIACKDPIGDVTISEVRV